MNKRGPGPRGAAPAGRACEPEGPVSNKGPCAMDPSPLRRQQPCLAIVGTDWGDPCHPTHAGEPLRTFDGRQYCTTTARNDYHDTT